MSGVKLYRLLSLLAVLLLATMAAAPFPQAPANPGCPPAGCPAPGEMVVARVDYGIRARLDALAPSLDIWEVNAAEGWLLAQIPYSSVAALQAQGYTVAVDWEQTAALHQPNLPLAGQTQGIPSYPCYRTVEETYTALQTLATTYPGLVMLTDIGDSWDKVTVGGPAGYDILEITLTNGEIPGPKPVFFLMAEIHAREYVTAETATRLAEHLTANYGVDPDITWLLDYNEIHIVPMTNPDGRKFAEAGQSWRKNTDNDDGCASTYGTDLNRNHSFKWGGASNNPCGETYQGPSAGSEPETQVIQNYVLGVLADRRGPGDTDPAPLDYEGLFITLHSYSQLVLWPWGWSYSDAPNHTQLQTLGRKLAYFNNYEPSQSVDLYPTTGTSDDWAYGELGVPAYTYEMGTTFFQNCTSFESTIYPVNRNSLLYAFKAARRPYMTPAGPEVLLPALSDASVAIGDVVTLSASANDTRYQNSNGAEPTQAIAAARYSVDLPSWADGAVTFPMEASDGNFNATVEGITAVLDTTGWALGRHTIFMESQDAAGNWGVPTAIFLDVILDADPRGQTVPPGQQAEYQVTVFNPGTISEAFTVAVTSNWEAQAPATVGPVAPGESASFTVTVTVPAGAHDGDQDALTLSVSTAPTEIMDASLVLTTTAAAAATPKIYLPVLLR